MEPIPLRTLTLLLNYERAVSDPRFVGMRLLESTEADPSLPRRLVKSDGIHEHFKGGPDTIEVFFELCPPDQRLSVQMTSERPILIDMSPRSVIKFSINGPFLHVVTSTPKVTGGAGDSHIMTTGSKDSEDHGVLAFPCPGRKDKQQFVVDMTRMEYGEVGRGTYGENYFLGTLEGYMNSMRGVCVDPERVNTWDACCTALGGETETRMKTCAKRVWERWQNRDSEGWCEHCGKGGKELKRCRGCRMAKIWWCCREHQLAGWSLHKHTCERRTD
ncbi:hypothetical protein LHYA1_G002356 [Lachnellula hyalina]|uniref:MYND-type domain-containing protein n=1 Tax=Lachnellula hyalina TaxID=1316788 RepID=A0A8H8R559_9HELO|nr:uncharacterized protein LHYA1_G002356 [Lachnellula hyalina]TVY28619.1 hypothetical protein LHYA1_G002356 [Lachnellula hyalina]